MTRAFKYGGPVRLHDRAYKNKKEPQLGEKSVKLLVGVKKGTSFVLREKLLDELCLSFDKEVLLKEGDNLIAFETFPLSVLAITTQREKDLIAANDRAQELIKELEKEINLLKIKLIIPQLTQVKREKGLTVDFSDMLEQFESLIDKKREKEKAE